MTTREIVSLQVGHYSNYVGTHLWNIQESSFVYESSLQSEREINHDVLFREGQNLKRDVTFTPRLVAFDLKGSLNALKQEGSLYEVQQEEDDIKWSGDVTMHTENVVPKNQFLKQLDKEDGIAEEIEIDVNEDPEKSKEFEKAPSHQLAGSSKDIVFGAQLYHLDNTVKVWSDFLRTHYHPRSVQVVEEYRHKSELQPFDLYGCGQQLLSNYGSLCEWEDRLHFFVEECDHLQGFHVLLDTHDGFGGLGAGLLGFLEEEFTGKGIMTFGLTPTDLPDDTATARAARIINSALAYNKISTHSSLFTPCSLARGLWKQMQPPINLPYLQYKPISYHTSAILASVLDTLSMPYRRDTRPMDLRDITHSFNAQGKKMAALYSTLPLPLSPESSFLDVLAKNQQSFPWRSLTPHTKNEAVPLMQSVVLRGVPDHLVKSKQSGASIPRHLAHCEAVEEMLQCYLDVRCPGTLSATNVMRDPCKTVIPFPHIFSPNVGKDGLICGNNRSSNQGVESVPVMTSLQSTPEVSDVIDQLHSAASRLNIKKHHRYLELGLEEDEYLEILDSLQTLGQNYNTKAEAL